MRYFLVTAKCGHVGRNCYYEGKFPTIAESKSDAGKKAREFSRVKSDHEDAILWVEEISFEEYNYWLERYEEQTYFNCKSRSQQKEHWEEIQPYIRHETERTMKRLAEKNSYYKEKKSKKKGIRNPYKYAKYNMLVA